MLMNPTQMNEIRKDLNFLLDTLKNLKPEEDAGAKVLIQYLGAIQNKLIDIEDAYLNRSETPKPEGPFEIRINEYQRRLIGLVFRAAGNNSGFVSQAKVSPGDDAYPSAWEEVKGLQQMFEELPKHNKLGTTHGFCL